jgi:hypothetical protein
MKKQKKDYIDLYTDYLISVQGEATTTGLSDMLGGEVTHNKITRFLLKVVGYIKGYDGPVLLYRQTFKNRDGSIGMLHLLCSDTALDKKQITTIYKKRWKVEEYNSSLKHNTNLDNRFPTKTVTTQSNHIFLSIMAFFKLETLKIKYHLDHFALKTKLWIKANLVAFTELQRLKSV